MVERLHVFGWQGYNHYLESSLMRIFGPRYNHPIVQTIQEIIEEYGFTCEIFSAKLKLWRYVPLEELYDFDSKKWLVK
jgi:hypothetical protein